MLNMGGDFFYTDANMWYTQLDKIIKHLNEVWKYAITVVRQKHQRLLLDTRLLFKGHSVKQLFNEERRLLPLWLEPLSSV